MKNIVLSGILGAVIAVAINYAIISFANRFGWMNHCKAPCLPELAKLLNSGTKAVIVQTLFCAAIGLIIGVLLEVIKLKNKSI